MAFKDNREFIAALDSSGDVVHVRQEVDWDLEAGAIVRRVSETQQVAPLFEKIRDYPEGYRIFGAPLATKRRLSVAFGLPADTPYKQVRDEYEQRLEHPIKPVVVKTGPCKENLVLGSKVDLFQFPAPMVHEGDGGRYIGTWHGIVCKDLEQDWTNWGMYRLMVVNPRVLAGLCQPYSHMWLIYSCYYLPRKMNMPVAIAIGMDPACSIVSCSRVFGAQDEADYAGAIRQEPVELVKCETNDLLVPAHSEIVLEGELLTGQTVPEGPFGEYTGYRSEPREPRFVYRINAITFRNDPILTMTCMGIPTTSDTLVRSMDYELLFKRVLRRMRIPFTDVHVPVEFATMMAIVGIKPTYAGIPVQIGNLFAAAQLAAYKVIVVEDDVDVFNLAEVLHALASKCHPSRSIKILEGTVDPSPLNPFLSPEERRLQVGAKAVFDCTWPVDWSKETVVPPRVSFNEMYPAEVKEKVTKNWANYGFH